MSTNRRTKSARENGAKARGTKTPEGIARSSANAITHGLTSHTIVLATESEAEFLKLRESYLLQFSPRNQVEADIVDQLIAARWRLVRLWSIETSLLDLELVRQQPAIEEEFEVLESDVQLAIAFQSLADKSRALALLNRYEARLQRTCNRALESLRVLREIQNLQNDPKPADAVEKSAGAQSPSLPSPDCERNKTAFPQSPLTHAPRTGAPSPAGTETGQPRFVPTLDTGDCTRRADMDACPTSS